MIRSSASSDCFTNVVNILRAFRWINENTKILTENKVEMNTFYNLSINNKIKTKI